MAGSLPTKNDKMHPLMPSAPAKESHSSATSGTASGIPAQEPTPDMPHRMNAEGFWEILEDQTEFICRFLPDGTHIFVNDAYCRYFALSEDKVLDHIFFPIIPEEDKEIVRQHFSALTHEKPVAGIVHRIVMPDGSVRWQNWSDRAIFDNTGQVIEYQSVGRDVTEIKLMEEELKTANKKLNLLTSITRHDIRNKLTSLLAYTELAKVEANESQKREFLQKIGEIALVINERLEFTCNYQDLGQKGPVWQDLHRHVSDTCRQIELGNAKVTDTLDGIWVFADPLLSKVIYNLIENAIRHGEHVTAIRLWHDDREDRMVIICEDDGVGISESDKNSIFKKGFGKHTGLGLYLSREILEISCLTIEETGTPGKGARFEITVPKGRYRFVRGNGAWLPTSPL